MMSEELRKELMAKELVERIETTKYNYRKSIYLSELYAIAPRMERTRNLLRGFFRSVENQRFINHPVIESTRHTSGDPITGRECGFDYRSGGTLYEVVGYSCGETYCEFQDATLLDVALKIGDEEMVEFLRSKGGKTLEDVKKEVFEKALAEDLKNVSVLLHPEKSGWCFTHPSWVEPYLKVLSGPEVRFLVHRDWGHGDACTASDYEQAKWMIKTNSSARREVINLINKGYLSLNIPLDVQMKYFGDHWGERRMTLEEYIRDGCKNISDVGWAMTALERHGIEKSSIHYRFMVENGAKSPQEVLSLIAKTKKRMAKEEEERRRIQEEKEAEERRIQAEKLERKKRTLKFFGLLWIWKLANR
jgi:hypothetical protein